MARTGEPVGGADEMTDETRPGDDPLAEENQATDATQPTDGTQAAPPPPPSSSGATSATSDRQAAGPSRPAEPPSGTSPVDEATRVDMPAHAAPPPPPPPPPYGQAGQPTASAGPVAYGGQQSRYGQQPYGGQQPPGYGGQQPPGYGGQQPPGYGGQQPPGYGGQQPPYGGRPPYGQPPYGGQPPGYGPPPPGYGYPPPRKSGGSSGVLVAVLVIGLLLALGVGALYALGIGPFAPSGTPPVSVGSPTPGLSTPTPAVITPTPQAQTPLPTEPAMPTAPAATPTEPAASPTEPAASPTAVAPSPTGDATEQLLSHIPEDLRDSCIALPGTEVVALASCAADDGDIGVTYFLHSDPATMTAAYDGFVAAAGVEPGTGTCEDEESWPAEGSYSINDEPTGRVLCAFTGDVPMMWWTDDRLNIVSQATGMPGEADRLYDFWAQEAGPNP